MEMATNTIRKDGPEKVCGQAKYTADWIMPQDVYGVVVQSSEASGKIIRLDLDKANKAPGVLLALSGDPSIPLTGVLIQDRPILAADRVRYAGEPVAVIVAQTKAQARWAALQVEVEIERTPVVLTTTEALKPGAPLLHENSIHYTALVEDVLPQAGTNIAASYKIDKGNLEQAWTRCTAATVQEYFLPPSAHASMEPKAVQAQMRADGTLWILSATQSPYTVRQLLSECFSLELGKVEVETPYVGGGFGGKSTVQLEYIAALAAIHLPGKRILFELSREEEMTMSPTRMGVSAKIKLGADANGRLIAAEMQFDVDCGAYSDIAPNMAKAIAVDCTGPYALDNLYCSVRCVYTNHNYSTAFRGFAHESLTFCIERAIDSLAEAGGFDALTLRANSAIREGDLTPSQVTVTRSNLGDMPACISALKRQINWDEGARIDLGNGIIRAKGISGLWKTPTPALDASAGAVVTFNDDGSVNLNVGVVEMGNGSITRLAEFLAEKLRIPYEKVNVPNTVDTRISPKYWKTVASISNYLVGRAVMQAADDALLQLKKNASIVLRIPVEDLEYGEGRVYVRHQPKFAIGYQDLAFGVALPDGNTIGSPVIGRGSFVVNHAGPLAKDTGRGKTGHSWTVGAQGVEI